MSHIAMLSGDDATVNVDGQFINVSRDEWGSGDPLPQWRDVEILRIAEFKATSNLDDGGME